jgi:hypothetical protein
MVNMNKGEKGKRRKWGKAMEVFTFSPFAFYPRLFPHNRVRTTYHVESGSTSNVQAGTEARPTGSRRRLKPAAINLGQLFKTDT